MIIRIILLLFCILLGCIFTLTDIGMIANDYLYVIIPSFKTRIFFLPLIVVDIAISSILLFLFKLIIKDKRIKWKVYFSYVLLGCMISVLVSFICGMLRFIFAMDF